MKTIGRWSRYLSVFVSFAFVPVAFSAVPAILGINPASGPIGAVVTIAGTNFSTTPLSNVVYFGPVQATVSSASPTSLTVSVPSGAMHAPVTVTVNGLIAYSDVFFEPTFLGNGSSLGLSNFAARVDIGTGSGPTRIAVADFDGDGKPDLAVANINDHTIEIFQNISSNGSLDAGSFAARVIIPFPGSLPEDPYWLAAADIDGDGKIDLIAPDESSGQVIIYRNISSGGVLTSNSFAAPVAFNVGSTPRQVVVADLDGDGRPDIVSANLGDNTISILRNIGSAGTIDSNSFAPQVVLPGGSEPHDLAIGDLDGDGRPDIVFNNYESPFVSIYRNVSVPGTLDTNSFESRVDLPAPLYCSSVALGDMDGDGKLDIVCSSSDGSDEISVFANNSTPGVLTTNSFAPRLDFPALGWVDGVTLGDLAGEGKLDIALVNQLPSSMSLFQNIGTGSFSSSSLGPRLDFSSGLNPYGVQIVDLDGDGRPDIVFVNTYGNTLSIYQNIAPSLPQITSQPEGQTVAVGGTASFSVTASGAPTVMYQWFNGSGSITGATNATLTLNNVSLSAAGSYYVTVNNPYGSTNSSSATLTVTNPPMTCTPAPSGLVGWWKGEDNANDSAGTNNGSLSPGGASYTDGKVGQAFQFDGTNGYMQVPDSSVLKPANVTIEAWVWLDPSLPSGRGHEQIVFKKNPQTAFFEGYDLKKATLQDGTDSDHFQFVVSSGADQVVINSQTIAQRGVWYHVAATYDGTRSTLYVNGVAEASAMAGFALNYDTTPLYIGTTGTWAPYLNMFDGIIDEVSIYNRALSPGEIQSIYNAGSAGKCSATVTPSCTPAPAGITAWWKAESNAVDSVGGNNGTLINGAGFEPGEVNQAFSLNGTSSYVLVQSANSNLDIGTGSGMTIEGWINPLTVSQQQLLCEWENALGTDSGADVGVNFAIQASTQLYINIKDMSGNDHEIYSPANLLSSGTWQHVATTYDTNSGVGSLYINGALVASQSVGSYTPETSFSNFLIGGRTTFASEFSPITLFGGGMDEWTLYNRALSQSEIAAIYNAGGAGKCPVTVTNPPPSCTPAPSGLVAWWRAEGNFVDSINDNIGTALGSVSFAPGEVGTGFDFTLPNVGISVPASSSLNLSTGSGVTLEEWINPSAVNNANQWLVGWKDLVSNIYGVHMALSQDGPSGCLFGNIKDTSNGNHTWTTTSLVTNGGFQHVALTYDQASGIATLYYNGAVAAQANLGSFTPDTTEGMSLGSRASPNAEDTNFLGVLDGVSVYNRALSQSEIAVIYNAGSAGKCSNNAPTAVPVITSISPVLGDAGSAVTIKGSNFSATPANNTVYFGAVQAAVTSASTSNLTATLPTGATYGPITEIVQGLMAESSYPFLPTFPGASPLSSTSLNNSFNLNLGSGREPWGVVVGDLDGDGKPDVVTVNASDATIWIYRNISSNGTLTADSFAAPVILTAAPSTSVAGVVPALADLTGDGRLDIVFANFDAGTVSVFQNLSTPGSLTFAPRVDYVVGGQPTAVAVRDLDGDGKPEIIVANRASSTLSVLQNLSTGGLLTTNSFALAVTLATGPSPNQVVAADIDGDGKFDLLSVNYGDTATGVSLFQNTSSAGNISFAPRVDLSTGAGEEALAVGDMDGDGKLDLIVGSYDTGQFSVYRNIGSPGNITASSFAAPVTFTAGGPIHQGGIALGDIDGDGRPDVAVVDQNSGLLYLYRNLSSPGSFTSSSLGSPVTFPSGYNSAMVAINDFNGDGRPDIVIANTYGNNLTIWENVVPLAVTNPPPMITSISPVLGDAGSAVTINGSNFSATAANNIVYFGAVQAAVTGASTSQLTVTVPEGATFAPITETVQGLTAESSYPFLPTFPGGSPLSSSSLSNSFNLGAGPDPFKVSVGDMDGDGKPDVVAFDAGDSTIWIYRNISSNGTLTAASFAPPLILTSAPPVNIAGVIATLADVDGDGRLDIVYPDFDSGTVSVFQNLSTPGNLAFAPRVAYPVGFQPQSSAVGDLDGDGKPEIIVANSGDSTVSVLKNLSSGGLLTSNSFAAPMNLATPSDPEQVVAADIDGDGRLDIVTVNYESSSAVSIYRNTSSGGILSFAPRVDLTSSVGQVAVAVGDMDGDGKVDLVVGSYNNDNLTVYRNIGSPGSITTSSFAAPVTFAAGGPVHQGGIALGDIDGDGKPDVAVVDQDSGNLYLYRNLSTPGSFTSSSLGTPVTFPSGNNSGTLAIADFNGDGRPDIVIANTYGNNLTIWENAVPFAGTTQPPPVITSISPVLGDAGSMVTITGSNFAATAAGDIVYFGAVQATVTAGNTSQLTVIAPTNATFAPVTVTVNGLTANSDKPYMPTFAGLGPLTNSSFAPAFNLNSTLAGPEMVIIADLDGDGKPDLVVGDTEAGTVSVFQNMSTDGSLSAASFGPPVTLHMMSGGGGNDPFIIAVADLDGDGRPDIVAADAQNNVVSIFRNISAPGTLTSNSFAARIDLPAGNLMRGVAVQDLDGDGRPEIVVGNAGDNNISIYDNESTVGHIAFAPRVSLPAGSEASTVVIGDLDGDGLPDIAVANYTGGTISVFRNLGFTGTIATSSFAPAVNIPAPASPAGLALGDIDGDGKLDMVVGGNIDSKVVSVLRNTSTPGSITTSSFAPHVDFALPGWANWVALADLDGDGKLDIAVVTQLGNGFSVFDNISTPGSFTTNSLAPRLDFPTGSNPNGIAVGDLNGDGRPDVVFANFYDGTISVYQNVSPPAPPPCTPAPSGLVAWWPGQGNGNDIIGGNNGELEGGVTFAAGEVGQAFDFNGTTAGVEVPASPSLNVGTNGGVTIEGWVSPANLANPQQWVFGWKSQADNYGANVKLSQNGPAGNVLWNVKDTFGNNHIVTSGAVLSNNVFEHLAVTYDQVSGVATIYCNGVVVAQQTLGSYAADTTEEFFLGTRASSNALENAYGGLLDEVSVYNRALSQSEVQAIYNAGSGGKCFVPVPPSITTQPVNQNVIQGGTTSFFVGAAGSPTLSYQWFFGATSLPGATNALLVLSNLQPSQAGPYHAVVSNPYGSTNSASATLSVSFRPATVQVVNTTPAPAGTNVVTVPINFVANGNENALSFSLNFDTNRLNLMNLYQITGLETPHLVADTSQATNGRVGIQMTSFPGTTFSAGTQTLFFMTFSTPTLTGTQAVTTTISFDNTPVAESLTDTNNNPLAFSLLSGTVTLSPSPGTAGPDVVIQQPTLSISSGGANVVLSWPTSAGDFNLQAVGSLTAPVNWTNVPVTLQTNGGNIQVTLPMSAPQTFYRLSYP